jgi:hypothetical protein
MTTMRVTREQILEASKGMLQKQFYVVFSTPTSGIGPVMEKSRETPGTPAQHRARRYPCCSRPPLDE